MKIKIYPMKYDGDGSYYTDSEYNKPPIEGAYKVASIRVESHQEAPDIHGEQYIDYDDTGKPFIANRRIEKWLPTQKWWIDLWKRYGFNHQYDADNHIWTREFNENTWVIDVEDYKTIVDWMVQGDIYSISESIGEYTYEVCSYV